MRRSRIVAWLGPAALTYAVVDLAANQGFDMVAWVVVGVALLASATPALLRGRVHEDGALRVAALGLFSGFTLLAFVGTHRPPPLLQMVSGIGACACSALVVDLALTVPRAAFRRIAWLRVLSGLTWYWCAVLGVAAFLPVFTLFGETVIVPGRWQAVPVWGLWAGGVVALLIRVSYRRAGRRADGTSDAEGLASNGWALLGLVPNVTAGFFVAAFHLSSGPALGPWPSDSVWLRLLATAGLAVNLLGHAALVDPGRRLEAGPATRRGLAYLVTAALVVPAALLVHPQLSRSASSLVLWSIVLALFGALAFRSLQPLVEQFAAPFGGRLLRAARATRAVHQPFLTLQELAQSLLPLLRGAAHDPMAVPLLFTLEPAREASIDQAGTAHAREKALPQEFLAWLAQQPVVPVDRFVIDSAVVRQPALRPIAAVLNALDALAVLPLVVEGELEGVLVVPRGSRRTRLALEELRALEAVADFVAARVSLLAALYRAQGRANSAERALRGDAERISQLEAALSIARLEAERSRRVVVEEPAYSPAARAMRQQLARAAALDSPLLLLDELGTPTEEIARALHSRGKRSAAPFVVVDCASLKHEQHEAELLGDETDAHPGWLRLASGGSLVLLDVPALSLSAQRALADAIAQHQARGSVGCITYPVDVRLIATSRCDLRPLIDAEQLDPALGKWLCAAQVRVPPLRQRREDLPSLVLAAIDRACRRFAHPALGLDQDALDALLAYPWPGNHRELQEVVEAAVRSFRAHPGSSPQLGIEHLGLQRLRSSGLNPRRPAAAQNELGEEAALSDDVTVSEASPSSRTYADHEKHLLWSAMERARGNKSEAARTLGLKRTTFLDKLRRHGL